MEEEKKFEKEERLKLEEKKKEIINQFIFLLHAIFLFSISTHPKLFIYVKFLLS